MTAIAIKALEFNIKERKERLEHQITERERSLGDVASRQTTIIKYQEEIKELEDAVKKLQE